MTIENLYLRFLECSSISTDTRKIEKDSLFFALKGDKFNGNTFAEQALQSGAKYVVIDEKEYKKDDRFILTDDVLTTLQKLANFHRKQFDIPFIAVTGSNGKTTTKELLNAVLSKKYKTHATVGNLNNHIGIPITLLAIKKGTEIAIIEMGANHQKEIASYCQYTEPTHGIITNIGKAHLEGFGGIEGVKMGKGELYDYLLQNGTIFLNTNQEALVEINKFPSPVNYPNKGNYYQAKLLEETPYVILETEEGDRVQTHLTGKYNYDNIVTALCAAKYFGVPASLANQAISEYVPQNNRSQFVEKGSNKILLDAYNANPSSMKAAIDNFIRLQAPNKVLILGDMYELGEESALEHQKIGEQLQPSTDLTILLCGKNMKQASEACSKAKYFENKIQLEEFIKNNPILNSTILLKGSRGMGMETLQNLL